MRQRIQRPYGQKCSTFAFVCFVDFSKLVAFCFCFFFFFIVFFSFNSLQFWFNSIQLLCNSMRRVCSLSVRQAPFKWGTTRQQQKKKQQRFSQGMQHTRGEKRSSLHMAYILQKNQHWITTEDHQSYDQKVEIKNSLSSYQIASRDKLTISISIYMLTTSSWLDNKTLLIISKGKIWLKLEISRR